MVGFFTKGGKRNKFGLFFFSSGGGDARVWGGWGWGGWGIFPNVVNLRTLGINPLRTRERVSVVEGKGVDLAGSRLIRDKSKNTGYESLTNE